jgi:hypothetical protein
MRHDARTGVYTTQYPTRTEEEGKGRDETLNLITKEGRKREKAFADG